jgi:hypothetical protein
MSHSSARSYSFAKLKVKSYVLQVYNKGDTGLTKLAYHRIARSIKTNNIKFKSHLYSFGKFTICYNASNLQYAVFSDIQT